MNYGKIKGYGSELVELSFSDGSLIRFTSKQTMEFKDWLYVVIEREKEAAAIYGQQPKAESGYIGKQEEVK